MFLRETSETVVQPATGVPLGGRAPLPPLPDEEEEEPPDPPSFELEGAVPELPPSFELEDEGGLDEVELELEPESDEEPPSDPDPDPVSVDEEVEFVAEVMEAVVSLPEVAAHRLALVLPLADLGGLEERDWWWRAAS